MLSAVSRESAHRVRLIPFFQSLPVGYDTYITLEDRFFSRVHPHALTGKVIDSGNHKYFGWEVAVDGRAPLNLSKE